MRSMPAFLALVVVFALRVSPALAVPPLQVKVDFNSNANFKTSDGTQRFATPANLTPAQKAAIIAKASDVGSARPVGIAHAATTRCPLAGA